jgi:hypothetical protein
LQLYILIYETTRKEKHKKNNGKPFYIYYLPDEFIKNGTSTKHFMDIVSALRHKYAHSEKPEPGYKVPIKKIKYPDVLQELLGNKRPP